MQRATARHTATGSCSAHPGRDRLTGIRSRAVAIVAPDASKALALTTLVPTSSPRYSFITAPPALVSIKNAADPPQTQVADILMARQLRQLILREAHRHDKPIHILYCSRHQPTIAPATTPSIYRRCRIVYIATTGRAVRTAAAATTGRSCVRWAPAK